MTSRRIRVALACLVLSVLAVVLTGCESPTPIARLLDDPGQYEGQTVWVAGEAKSGLGILNYGAFELSDRTGTIVVVSEKHGAPREGAEVAVKGVFHAAFTVGSRTAAVIVEAERKSR